MSARIVFRPLAAWTDPVSHPAYHPFRASWLDSTNLLEREVAQLNGRYEEVEVVLQVQTSDHWMRRDGGIRADAKVTGDGVVISFDSIHGPLRYACDAFTGSGWRLSGWQANVRAIALTLEALRKVDRYGSSHRGEQYTGFNALGSGRPMPAAMTVADARTLLMGWMEIAGTNDWQTLYRRAVKSTHPDAGGDADEFDRVQTAYDLLRATGAA